ncbi:MAG: hypothetical protein IPK02_17665 [Candidatus Accumulibacter sp.]|uniref:Uncharacterized protein n=1 Tax=Candidatus Accumulibacter affinis TaxID=2954384 RepID=A0A935TDB1_9PROT|nr:hypothetical protein [Candidatus Accumulibacter affinis]
MVHAALVGVDVKVENTVHDRVRNDCVILAADQVDLVVLQVGEFVDVSGRFLFLRFVEGRPRCTFDLLRVLGCQVRLAVPLGIQPELLAFEHDELAALRYGVQNAPSGTIVRPARDDAGTHDMVRVRHMKLVRHEPARRNTRDRDLIPVDVDSCHDIFQWRRRRRVVSNGQRANRHACQRAGSTLLQFLPRHGSSPCSVRGTLSGISRIASSTWPADDLFGSRPTLAHARCDREIQSLKQRNAAAQYSA